MGITIIRKKIVVELFYFTHSDKKILLVLICTANTVFMLIGRMIQLPQKKLIPGIVCIPLERKPLPVIIFSESD